MNNVFFEPALEVWANILQLLRTNPTKLQGTFELASSLLPSQPVYETHIYRTEKTPTNPTLHNSWENESYMYASYCKVPPLVVVHKEKKG